MGKSNSILLAVLAAFAPACLDHQSQPRGRNQGVESQESASPANALGSDAESSYHPPQEYPRYGYQACVETNCTVSGTLTLRGPTGHRGNTAEHTIGEKTYGITLTGIVNSFPTSIFFSVEGVINGLAGALPNVHYTLPVGECGDLDSGTLLMATDGRLEKAPEGSGRTFSVVEADYCLIPPAKQ